MDKLAQWCQLRWIAFSYVATAIVILYSGRVFLEVPFLYAYSTPIPFSHCTSPDIHVW